MEDELLIDEQQVNIEECNPVEEVKVKKQKKNKKHKVDTDLIENVDTIQPIIVDENPLILDVDPVYTKIIETTNTNKESGIRIKKIIKSLRKANRSINKYNYPICASIKRNKSNKTSGINTTFQIRSNSTIRF
jgi:hypothetical protein